MTRTPVVLAAFLIACGAPTEEPPPPQPAAKRTPASIRTDRTRYVLEHGLFGPEATIVATFTAPKDRTVYLLNCNGALSTGLQRRIDDAWVNAWGAAINGCMSPPIVVPPGGEHVDRIVIRPGAGAVIHPSDGREMIEPGTYRVVWHFVLTSFDMNARPHGDDLPLEQRVSAPIVIEAAAPRPAVLKAIEPPEGARIAVRGPRVIPSGAERSEAKSRDREQSCLQRPCVIARDPSTPPRFARSRSG